MAQSTTLRAATFILRELIGEVLYFPIWWYSSGTRLIWAAIVRQWLGVAYRLSLVLLLKNMFRPMYADYTRSGRIISFFIRLILIFTRLIVLAIWTILSVLLFMLWLASPVAVIGMFIRQLLP